MGSSSSSRAPAASRSNVKKQQGECAGGRKANDDIVCLTSTGTDNEYDSSVEIETSFEILSEVASDSSSDESDSSIGESDDEVDVFIYEEERALVLAEALALRKAAVDYAHPEVGVVTLDYAVCGRNYFNRFSAPEVEDVNIREQAQILADVKALKEASVDYAHPEVEVITSDPCVYGRNYFNRVSKPEDEDEDIEERALILAEALALKTAAADYTHGGVGVSTSDPNVYGRNYFSRFSPPEVEDENIEEQAQILDDVRTLKKYAVHYAHPEVGVTTSDPTTYGRNYFNHASAPEAEDKDIEEKAAVLADATELKKAAVDYAYLGVEISISDPNVYGRNYFNRLSSVPEVEGDEDIDEQAQVITDMIALKKSAVDYAHPEVGVITSDPTLYGRNYFNRASAPEIEDEDMEESAFILAETLALKKAAADYAHPEVGVSTSDPNAYGRNYFSCFSAPEVENEDIEEQAQILADVKALRKSAADHAHPEARVIFSDPTLYGRNYSNHASAPEVEGEDMEEKAMVLGDAIKLKKAAADYAHPGVGVSISDPSVYGRNYFNRFSAPEVKDEDIEEQAQILADVIALKEASVDYAHPEVGVITSDPTLYGHDYFNRASAPEVEDEDMEERALILAEALALKKATADYGHPEVGVSTSDPSVYGRNYFSRFSAPEVEAENIEEQAQIRADVRALKKSAVDYAHPEDGGTAPDPTLYGHNYFSRYSAPEVEDEDIEERALILAEALALKKAAVDYAHPEVGVSTSDLSVYGRNYFNRFSAPEVEAEKIDEQAQILVDVRALKKNAVDYAPPVAGITTSDPTVYGRNYFSRYSAPEVEGEDMEEKAMVLADALALKKVATHYGHPEVGIVTSDPSVYGRNFYNRYGTDHPAISTVSTIPYPSMRKERAMSNVSETLEFDDDIFNHIREDFQGMEDLTVKKWNTLRDEGGQPQSEGSQPEDEGKLSRSPSSVMLISLVDGAGY